MLGAGLGAIDAALGGQDPIDGAINGGLLGGAFGAASTIVNPKWFTGITTVLTAAGTTESFVEGNTWQGLFRLALGILSVGTSVVRRSGGSAAPAFPSAETAPGLGTPASRLVYRLDSRSPAEIFRDGFTSKGTNTDVWWHARYNPSDSAYIATTKELNVILDPSKLSDLTGFKGSWVYLVDSLGGVDVNAQLGAKSPFPFQAEIAIPFRVPPEFIMGARQLVGNNLVGDYYENPNWNP